MSQQESSGASVVVSGRLVYGFNLFTGNRKVDENTKAPILNQDGTPVIEFSSGLAISKNDFAQHVWPVMQQQALQVFPSGQFPPDFAWKYKDGDAVDHNGVPFRERPGYAGNIVLNLSTRIAPKFFRFDAASGKHIFMTEGIKVGDYVDVVVSIVGHPAKGRGKAGLYLNPTAMRFVAFGEEIVNKATGETFFGNNAPVVPAGGSLTPLPSNIPMPGMPPSAPAAPYFGMLPAAHQPQGNATPPVAPPMPTQYGQPTPNMGFPGGAAPGASPFNQGNAPWPQPGAQPAPPQPQSFPPGAHQPPPNVGQPPMPGGQSWPQPTTGQQGGFSPPSMPWTQR